MYEMIINKKCVANEWNQKGLVLQVKDSWIC